MKRPKRPYSVHVFMRLWLAHLREVVAEGPGGSYVLSVVAVVVVVAVAQRRRRAHRRQLRHRPTAATTESANVRGIGGVSAESGTRPTCTDILFLISLLDPPRDESEPGTYLLLGLGQALVISSSSSKCWKSSESEKTDEGRACCACCYLKICIHVG